MDVQDAQTSWPTFGVAPNGVLPSAKVKQAILRLCDNMKINGGRHQNGTFRPGGNEDSYCLCTIPAGKAKPL